MDSPFRVPRLFPFGLLMTALLAGGALMASCASTDPADPSKTAPDTVATGPDGDSAPSLQAKRQEYSTYYEHYKNDDFASARRSLLWILEQAPKYPKGDDRNYRRVVKLYEGLADQSADTTAKAAYLDTAATYLATAPRKMEKLEIPFERYRWEIRKGRFVDRHEDALRDTTALESATSHYERAFQLAPEEVDSYYIRRVLRAYLEADSLEGALDIANAVSKTRGDDEKVAALVKLVRQKVFARNPQDEIAYLKGQVDQHPDSTQLLTDLFIAYRENGNASEAATLADRLLQKTPSPEAIREIAEMRLENGQIEEALAAYEQAEDEGAELTYQDYFNRGTAYQEIGQPARARREYRNALTVNDGFGQAYIAIGDLYVRAVNQCSGEKVGRQDRAVYWVAVDKYQQAKRADPSVSEVASRRIATYTKVFPTQEDIFYQSEWEAGSSFPIDYGCYSWIGETTTVRSAPSTE